MNPFKKTEKSVSIFITAGYPNKTSLPEQIQLLQDQGIDFLEIGIPFSDPMADGPVIQEISSTALKNGMNLKLLFEQLSEIKEQIKIPLVLMGYLNPILQFGLTAFLEKCKSIGVSGLIIPDLSFELVQQKYLDYFRSFDVPLIYLITPATSDLRIAQIAHASSRSFIYLVGQNKITGSSYSLSVNSARYSEIKSLCGEVPLFLGFGISDASQKREAFSHADGVIIGSAYLKALSEQREKEFLENLLS
ncbi:tryptophan synthase subunit alpha [Fluviicola chungangensis]|uniref:Tryptophan synthase alpha chain n=1 Tax=Fluviicola chungangensis TaxID=2597671 RepID=A0A556N0U8_9FLAO|nr:tryptophan synthase subunit alpha [Fluviicola chungangensis]TSJ45821.1 tryptophan synthase subunit alpha [Fluviicola chungangensis]